MSVGLIAREAARPAYARMLREELAKKGVHVGHTAIAGRIAPGEDHEPDDVAEALWRHHADHSFYDRTVVVRVAGTIIVPTARPIASRRRASGGRPGQPSAPTA